ncbi:hypothetical protein BpHYR1_051258 [Brachionus plicatilis]|uniref:Uncharacterized protein n=1 Tax=Brachionus plicatilis TaxID=10195 RepID=A0A3M7T9I7_BRAPC|nr:hypothetical protein BpHYR1_051258 [Brachionus plicatilis]
MSMSIWKTEMQNGQLKFNILKKQKIFNKTTARLACGDGLLGDRKASYPFLNLLTESASVTVAGRAFHSFTILLKNFNFILPSKL